MATIGARRAGDNDISSPPQGHSKSAVFCGGDGAGTVFRAGAGAGQAGRGARGRAAGLAGALADPLEAANPGRARPARMGRGLARQRKAAHLDATVALLHGLGIFDVGRRSATRRRARLGGKASPDEPGISAIVPCIGSRRLRRLRDRAPPRKAPGSAGVSPACARSAQTTKKPADDPLRRMLPDTAARSLETQLAGQNKNIRRLREALAPAVRNALEIYPQIGKLSTARWGRRSCATRLIGGSVRRRTRVETVRHAPRPDLERSAPAGTPLSGGVPCWRNLEDAAFENPGLIVPLKPLAGRLPRSLAPSDGGDGGGTRHVPHAPQSGFAGVGRRS